MHMQERDQQESCMNLACIVQDLHVICPLSCKINKILRPSINILHRAREMSPFLQESCTACKMVIPCVYSLQYKLEASFLEIYNETIRDLLSPSPPSNTTIAASVSSHDIKLDPSHPGGVYVTNVTPVMVTSQSQVATLLRRAARNRAVAATNCNERSSRSHSVFRLLLTGNNDITGEKCKGQSVSCLFCKHRWWIIGSSRGSPY